MKGNQHPGNRTLILLLLCAHLLFLALFHFTFQSVTAATALFSALLVLAAALVCGNVFGTVSGFILALAQILSLFLNGKPGFTLESIQSVSILARPDLLGLVFFPVFGLLADFYMHKAGIRRTMLEKKARSLDELNQSLTRTVDHYERSFQDLSREKVYHRSWDPLLNADTKVESIAGLLLASADSSGPAVSHDLLDRSQTGMQILAPDPANRLFDLLRQVRPDILAVLQLDGRLIAVSPPLMALFGFDADAWTHMSRFQDLLLPADAERATANMDLALEFRLKQDELYLMNSPDGGFSQLLISPWISLECGGSPLVLMARIVNPPRSLMDEKPVPDRIGRMEPAELAHHDFFCLSADSKILYISPAVARMLEAAPEKMAGQKIQKYVSRRQTARLETFLKAFPEGKQASLEIEMIPHLSNRTVLRLTACPSIGAGGHHLGTLLLVENITSMALVEETLQHRLSMEKLISSISTRFISIHADEMDQEIQNVLTQIGDFEGAEESQVEIRQSKHIRNPVKFHVANKKAFLISRPDIGYGQSTPLDRFETISIPIEIASENLGYFRFFLEQDQTNWFETDLELIGLIGQIIINALIRKENELKIKLDENRLSTTLHSIGDAVIATDTRGRVILMNKKAETLTGLSKEAFLYRPLGEVFKPIDNPDPIERDLPDVQNLHRFTETDNSMILESIDGRRFFISISRNPIEDLTNEVYGEVIVFRDVTREKQENDEIRYISYHDKLTGLYNRTFFEEELVRLNTPRQYPITLLLGDCNGLKIANDIFGHLEGDKLLQTIANILKKASRHEDIVARWGGDEFAIILPRTDEQAAANFRDRILQFCTEAENTPIQPSLALGSATNTDKSSDLVGLLKLAEDRMYRHKLMEGKSARSSILQSIEKMVYEKSYETEEHASRLEEISKKIGQAVGLTDYELEELNLLSVLHDMGKIGIPDNILLKPERLSDEEWEVMKKHSEKGYNLAKSTPELNSIADSILHHHEHWDGTGYPSGLRGDEIPRLSRILSIVDAYDVITHARSYKSAQSKAAALHEIELCSGTQFDPELAEVFIRIMRQADAT